MSEEKKARTIAKAQFTRAETHLFEALNEGKDKWAIERRYEDLKMRWNKTQDAHDIYVLSLSDDDEAAKEGQWIDEISNRFSKVELSVSKIFDDSKVQDTEETSDGNNDEAKVQTHQRGVQIERMKFNIFKGDIRKYPEFKSEFIKYIQPKCKAEELPFVLKSYLDETVREEVNNVGDVYSEMWKRLDMKYGNIGKLIDAILADVKKLSSNNNNQNDVLKMINTVEKAWRDLKAMGQSIELCNSTTISIIEQTMSKEMKTEWIKIIASKAFDSSKKFLALLDFLRDWRCRIEYELSEIREEETFRATNMPVHQVSKKQAPARKQRCWLHNLDGPGGEHPIWKCRLFQSKPVDERKTIVSNYNACKQCLVIGCPGAVNSNSCNRNFKCSVQGCGGSHNILLHSNVSGVNHNQYGGNSGASNPLLPIQELEASS